MEPTNPTEAILQFKVGEKSSDNAYKFLLLETKKLSMPTGGSFRAYLEPFEKDYMDKYLPDAVKWAGTVYENAQAAVNAGALRSEITSNKKKDGTYKYRTFLPISYSSAKAVITGALDRGIPLFDHEDKPHGKTSLSILINDTTSGKKTSSYEKCVAHIRAIKRQKDFLSPDELDEVRRRLAEI